MSRFEIIKVFNNYIWIWYISFPIKILLKQSIKANKIEGLLNNTLACIETVVFLFNYNMFIMY